LNCGNVQKLSELSTAPGRLELACARKMVALNAAMKAVVRFIGNPFATVAHLQHGQFTTMGQVRWLDRRDP